eukprot:GEMP01083238.1.p1 GENE.GEMP01083238.1~~GEMP01083238.1.p1  ORF type:complete len:118 (+),score=20.73 GEMP01083238.1:168-521(+)
MKFAVPRWATTPPAAASLALRGLSDDTQVDVPDGHIAIQKRCITIGSDPANDVVQPLMPLQALALAYHRNGKLYLYAFDNEALTGPLYVNGEAWTKESFVPLQVPCEVSHGEAKQLG